jgi:hypothetical protein
MQDFSIIRQKAENTAAATTTTTTTTMISLATIPVLQAAPIL